jgi:hypothetical protein
MTIEEQIQDLEWDTNDLDELQQRMIHRAIVEDISIKEASKRILADLRNLEARAKEFSFGLPLFNHSRQRKTIT